MKKILALTVCFMLIGVGSTFAEVTLERHSWELGTEISHIKYEEPGIMEEEGMMYGLVGSYTYRGWLPSFPRENDNLMLKTEGKASWGEVDYSSSDTGTMDNIEDYMLELRTLGGYDFPILEATILTPYIGFGYRYLNDDSSGRTTTTGHKGYERESNYFYSPIGIKTITKLENGWSVGLTVEYDLFWKGIQKSHLSDVDSSISDIENDQDDGYGMRGSVKFQKKGKRIDYVIEPFIKYWDIEKSDVEAVTVNGSIWGYGWEPENNSTEIGVNFAVKF